MNWLGVAKCMFHYKQTFDIFDIFLTIIIPVDLKVIPL